MLGADIYTPTILTFPSTAAAQQNYKPQSTPAKPAPRMHRPCKNARSTHPQQQNNIKSPCKQMPKCKRLPTFIGKIHREVRKATTRGDSRAKDEKSVAQNDPIRRVKRSARVEGVNSTRPEETK